MEYLLAGMGKIEIIFVVETLLFGEAHALFY